jgi:hypothetical protein
MPFCQRRKISDCSPRLNSVNGLHVAAAKRKPSQDARKGNRRHTGRAAAKDAANLAREGSKKTEVIDRMRRSQGATLAEIRELTGWQAHTVRGSVSGTLIKKLGLKAESFRSKETAKAPLGARREGDPSLVSPR